MTRIPIDPDAISDGKITIEGGDARHLVRVLRATPGDTVIAFDGQGREWPATLETVAGGRVTLELGEPTQIDRESPLRLLLGVGLTKGDTLERVLRMTTELGVAAVQPVITERSVARSVGAKKLDRWRRITLESCKQCGRNEAPTVAEPASLEQFLEWCNDAERKLLFWEQGGAAARDALAPGPCASAAVLVGPEGGLTRSEVEVALGAGFEQLTLGPRILRADTAAIAAVMLAQSNWGDTG